MYKYMYIYLNSNLRIGLFEQSNNPSCGCKLRPAGVCASLLRILAPCCKKSLPCRWFSRPAA
jgi:hypothetical protein